jgi:hypothetical protein
MQFDAYMVKQNKSRSVRVVVWGVISVNVGIAGAMLEIIENFCVFLILAGFAVMIIGAIAAGGKDLYEYTTDVLHIDEENVSIGNAVYPMASVTVLQFYYHSFYSQSSDGYYYEPAGMIEVGMNNHVKFMYNKQAISTLFSLANIDHANRFIACVQHLQQHGVRATITYRPFSANSAGAL